MGKVKGTASRASKKVTGFSTPLFGIQWEAGVSDSAVVESLARYLEDRRVLYASADVEVAEHCIQSVLDIRRELTMALRGGGLAADLTARLQAMRDACHRFLERLRLPAEAEEVLIVRQYADEHTWTRSGLDDWVMNQAIGELRGAFGVHLATIVGNYGIGLHGEINSILPQS